MVPPELLGRQSFFGELNGEQLQQVAALAREVSVPAGGALFYERHPADTLYVLLEGAVALYHSANDMRTAEALYFLDSAAETPLTDAPGYLVGEAHPGELIGISAMLEPHRLTATARASQPSRVIRIDALRLRELCQQDAALHTRLLTATAKTAMKRLHFTRAQLAAERT